MKTEKLYFKSIDDTFCSSLESFINDARLEGLAEITIVEAVPDNDNVDYIWCSQHGECVEKYLCKKSLCESYESKSGRGVCINRGHLYSHGEEVTFAVPTEAGI